MCSNKECLGIYAKNHVFTKNLRIYANSPALGDFIIQYHY